MLALQLSSCQPDSQSASLSRCIKLLRSAFVCFNVNCLLTLRNFIWTSLSKQLKLSDFSFFLEFANLRCASWTALNQQLRHGSCSGIFAWQPYLGSVCLRTFASSLSFLACSLHTCLSLRVPARCSILTWKLQFGSFQLGRFNNLSWQFELIDFSLWRSP